MDSRAMTLTRQTFALILLSVLTTVSYFSFSAVADAVSAANTSVFVVPTVWFLILLVVLLLGSILWQGWVYQVLAAFLVAIPSLIFAFTLVHVLVIGVASLSLFVGLIRIQHELRARLKFSFYQSVVIGASPIILALSLLISSQYYTHIEARSWDEFVPNFDLAEGTGAWMLKVVGRFSPSLSALQDRNLSVDSFLSDLRPMVAIDEMGGTLSTGVATAIRQAELSRSRLQLSHLLGREVNGGEHMNQVLSEVLRKKMLAFVSGSESPNKKTVPFLPFFLTLLLFFTIYPLGVLLFTVSLSIASAAFALLVRTGFVILKKIPVEQEVIE